MNLAAKSNKTRRRQKGWALLVVLSLATCALMVLASVMSWANENATVAERNSEYFQTSYAAESAVEKVISTMFSQYQDFGMGYISTNLSSYATILPNSQDSAYWANFQFSGGSTANRVIVTNIANNQQVVMTGTSAGLNLDENTYEIIANAQNINTEYQVLSTVGEQIYLGTIPLFQFAIFYQDTLEMAPGAAMTVSGPVHANTNIYLDPQGGLTFSATISSSGTIYTNQSPLDPSSRTYSWVDYNGSPAEKNGTIPLNLPVGTNATGTVSNSSQNVYAILQVPTSSETPTSLTGSNLLYNKADMIITINSNNTISVTSGAVVNNQATVISNSQWQTFLSTNGTFYDQRDSLTVNPVTINVGNLLQWSATNTVLNPVLATYRQSSSQGNVQSIYVIDNRNTSSNVVTTVYTTTTNYATNSTTTSGYPTAGTYTPPVTTNVTATSSSSKPATGTYLGSYTNSGGKYYYAKITGYTYGAITASYTTNSSYLTNSEIVAQPGIVLTNGATLPPQGLSIATPDPAYIVGNWNTKLTTSGSSDAGSSSTANSLPSAIYADAVTVLSQNWNPNNSTAALSSRTATTDTVNAALLTGNVPSNGSYYSGGVENFTRFLENWSGQTFYYNGSMVCMFPSQIADAPWPGTGTVYNPPTRVWGFDTNYTNPNKEPPMTPQIISVQRSKWSLLPPHATSF